MQTASDSYHNELFFCSLQFDMEFEFDPLFRKTSATFDGSGGSFSLMFLLAAGCSCFFSSVFMFLNIQCCIRGLQRTLFSNPAKCPCEHFMYTPMHRKSFCVFYAVFSSSDLCFIILLFVSAHRCAGI